ncbi:MAG: MarR family transcriptional regulator [Gemmatimonadota bacterium]
MTTSIQQQAFIAIMAASSRLRRQASCVLDGCGVSPSQYNVLRILRGAGGELPTREIRARMVDPEPSITRLVDRLEERELLERIPSSEDRRRVDCRLTPQGVALLAELDGPVDETDRALLSALSDSELETLIGLLDRVGLPCDASKPETPS